MVSPPTPSVFVWLPLATRVPALTVVVPPKVLAPARVDVPLLPCEKVTAAPLIVAPVASDKAPKPVVETFEPVSEAEPVRLNVPAVTEVAPV